MRRSLLVCGAGSQPGKPYAADSDFPNDSVPSDAVFEVGGGVIAPVLTYGSDPEYSEAARQARLEGTVLLTIVVGPDGSPRDIKVTRPLGSGLDEKAIETVKRWKFRPGTKDGRPVAVLLGVEVAFHLNNTSVAPGEPVHVVSAKYPKKARKEKVEGPVSLHVTVAADGSVKDVAVVSGDSRLTDAAVGAVREWRFQPFMADGKSVVGQREVTVNFRLAEDTASETRLDDSTDPIVTPGSGLRTKPENGLSVSPPRLTHSVDPENSMGARIDGMVVLSIVVGSDGRPRDIKVARSLSDDLDESAIEAVRQWRFKPATKDGKPVAVLIRIEVQFRR